MPLTCLQVNRVVYNSTLRRVILRAEHDEDTVTTNSLANRLRKLMADRGWSARETARRAGWGETAEVSNLLRRLDAGGTARTDTLEDLARAFGVSLGELVDGAPSSSDPTPTADDPPMQDVPLPTEMPETLGQRRDYARQEAAAKKELARRGESVEEWVWPHVRATNNFTLENSAPGVAMLCELAKFIASFGAPSAKPRK